MSNPDTNDPLRTLEREIDPPAALQARVRDTLTARGLLRPQRAPVWRRAAALAAASALFALGYVAGHGRPDGPPATADVQRYALFLYEDAGFDTSRPEAELVAEYSAWAAELRRQGQLVAGEQLAMSEIVLERSADEIVNDARGIAANAGTLTGLFIIRAASETEALRIARTCPHLTYGGRVAVRAIVGT